MNISSLDWSIIIIFFVVTLGIALWSARQSGKSARAYFLSGNNMPWWLLGVSMVATTFSADTPNLVTDIVRKDGIAGNWVWWAFLLTGMLTVFIYARLWRRLGIVTDLEFYELRYSGGAASFLRGFRAIYLGVFFNVMIMASVLLAGIKIGSIMLGLSATQTVLLVSIITVFYSAIGGLRGVILTDFFQFVLSMIGMLIATVFILQMPEIDGLNGLMSHERVVGKLDFVPDFSNMEVALGIFIVPLAVQWWSSWYPGAEPGGGGYVAQRMLSAKNEKDAVKATLFFNFAHYALRPWPWILIALASLIIFPDIASIQSQFPVIDDGKLGDDLAFPAMLTLLPKGLVGLLLASLIAALMSTISTHLNWGSSYIVNDFYVRFLDPDASEKLKVNIGRLSTVVLMILAMIIALGYLENAKQAFDLLLQIGAGTGLLFIMRWFWWRINAYSEITAMVISFGVALFFYLMGDNISLPSYAKLLIGVGVTTFGWLIVTFVTRATNPQTLASFVVKSKVSGIGWNEVIGNLSNEEKAIIQQNEDASMSKQIVLMLLGCVMVYGALFGMGYLLMGTAILGLLLLAVSVGIGVFIVKNID